MTVDILHQNSIFLYFQLKIDVNSNYINRAEIYTGERPNRSKMAVKISNRLDMLEPIYDRRHFSLKIDFSIFPAKNRCQLELYQSS